uniref:Uncharacterized protein LOC110220491 n=1 Tax=Phascolarctos cinereus TaxID=38626 RepID=A0A6P5LPA1_PHACI|nr:uncharacterized protein LOC110220491 [Phascolarctos cinereus]
MMMIDDDDDDDGGGNGESGRRRGDAGGQGAPHSHKTGLQPPAVPQPNPHLCSEEPPPTAAGTARGLQEREQMYRRAHAPTPTRGGPRPSRHDPAAPRLGVRARAPSTAQQFAGDFPLPSAPPSEPRPAAKGEKGGRRAEALHPTPRGLLRGGRGMRKGR